MRITKADEKKHECSELSRISVSIVNHESYTTVEERECVVYGHYY